MATAVLRILSAVALASLVSAQTPTWGPGWTSAWPSSSQATPVTFNPAWQADFNSIVFAPSQQAPVVPSAQVGKTNANYCDWSYNLCNATTDIIQCKAPMQWGLTFDDGPLPPQSSQLYTFLSTNGVKATHFMIGSNMVQFPNLVWQAYQYGGHIAVHSWTHHAMTTLDSQTAYAELRYPIEIIKNITGQTPIYWRPPYGDVDNRIRAIATHLNLTTVIWNQDTNDWCIGDANPAADGCPTGFTAASVSANLENWSTTQKTDPYGLVVLEHELSNGSVAQFMQAFPTMKSNGWQMMSVAACNDLPLYATSTNTTNVSSSVPASSAPATTAAGNPTGAGNGNGNGNGTAAPTSAPTTTKASAAVSLRYGAASAIVVLIAAVSQLL